MPIHYGLTWLCWKECTARWVIGLACPLSCQAQHSRVPIYRARAYMLNASTMLPISPLTIHQKHPVSVAVRRTRALSHPRLPAPGANQLIQRNHIGTEPQTALFPCLVHISWCTQPNLGISPGEAGREHSTGDNKADLVDSIISLKAAHTKDVKSMLSASW